MAPSTLQKGDAVGAGSRYIVRRKIGEGQFAEVYEVDDTRAHTVLALKLERRPEVRTVKQECKVLRHLQGCRQICKLYDSGVHSDRYFIVMDLLGSNLVEMRRAEQCGRAEMATVKVIGAGLLGALEALHRAGYIHRDVKPANFAVFPPAAAPTEGAWVLIDFGLARRFVDDEGKALAERQDASFRGSTTYASVHAHDDKDLSRRDDLWSWFYVVVELLEGTLPWRTDRGAAAADGTAGARDTKDGVAQRKMECMQHPEELFSAAGACPSALLAINKYLKTLGFGDEPNYELLGRLLADLDAQASVPPPVPNGNSAATQPAVLPPSSGATTSLVRGKARRIPSEPCLEPQLSAAQRGRRLQHGEMVTKEASAPDVPSKRALARASSSLAPEASERDSGSCRDRPGGRERDRDKERDRELETTRRRSRSRGRQRSLSRERSRTPRERRRSRSRRRRESTRSRSRQRHPRSRSRTRSPIPAQKDEWEQRDAERYAASGKQHKSMRHLVGSMRQDGMSEEVRKAAKHLQALPPSDAIAVACWYLDELSAGADPKHAAMISEVLDDAAAFVAVASRDCAGRARQESGRARQESGRARQE